jgi:uncharacterized protein
MPFLTAQWRYLAMANYRIDPAVLIPSLPRGTELDLHHGTAYVSVVGFLFLNTRVWGVPVPLHRDFEEVNLRFYVRRDAPDGRRRGVAFVKEIVPRRAVAALARLLYGENYVALPMRHAHDLEGGELRRDGSVEYGWRHGGEWNRLRVRTSGAAVRPAAGSAEEFIAEHYWGYAAAGGGAVEYRVEHPPWDVRQAGDVELRCNASELYGPKFAEALSRPPASAFVAEGSAVTVHSGCRI